MNERIILVRSKDGETHYLTLAANAPQLALSTDELLFLLQAIQRYFENESPYITVEVSPK